MKTIYSQTDFIIPIQVFSSTGDPVSLENVDSLDVSFFTLDETKSVAYTKEDIDVSTGYLHVDAGVLDKLENGILYYRYHIAYGSADFPDNTYDYSDVFQTNLYLQTGPVTNEKRTSATCVSELTNDADYIDRLYALRTFATKSDIPDAITRTEFHDAVMDILHEAGLL